MKILISAVIEAHYVSELTTRFYEHTFVHMNDNATIPPDIESVEVFLRCAIPVDQQERLISLAPQLKWIHTCSAGFDYLPLELIHQRGLTLTRSAQTNNIPIAEYVLAHILSFSKRLPEFASAQARHVWQRRSDLEELGDKTVGIIGAGSIGQALAKRCQALGMRVVAVKRNPEPLANFDEILSSKQLDLLLKQSDFVVVACPLIAETRGMLGAAELALMKETARLINVARGPIIVTSALTEALTSGRLAGAALDVFDEEPLPADSPLWTTPNLILTPHISYTSPHIMSRVLEEFATNLERYLAGEPLLNKIKDKNLGY